MIFGKIEKDLENLIANNMFSVLFEDSGLMPIFQERQRQKEADIYALNREGELIIFELKRSCAKKDAVQQALRYAQDAGQWGYSKLQDNLPKFKRGIFKSSAGYSIFVFSCCWFNFCLGS